MGIELHLSGQATGSVCQAVGAPFHWVHEPGPDSFSWWLFLSLSAVSVDGVVSVALGEDQLLNLFIKFQPNFQLVIGDPYIFASPCPILAALCVPPSPPLRQGTKRAKPAPLSWDFFFSFQSELDLRFITKSCRVLFYFLKKWACFLMKISQYLPNRSAVTITFTCQVTQLKFSRAAQIWWLPLIVLSWWSDMLCLSNKPANTICLAFCLFFTQKC